MCTKLGMSVWFAVGVAGVAINVNDTSAPES